jgi:hypothetical protein
MCRHIKFGIVGIIIAFGIVGQVRAGELLAFNDVVSSEVTSLRLPVAVEENRKVRNAIYTMASFFSAMHGFSLVIPSSFKGAGVLHTVEF